MKLMLWEKALIYRFFLIIKLFLVCSVWGFVK